ncbi:GMC family oxidoreductase [Polyangium jinanense]|uniref:GMC family oxidoreductase n=1 Tax=Polyangium jinanense TaxID=2829994 RepID=A0A9X4AWF9_9BACT|nr:GMC family oxidoreductase [Polyangium jinanense]MDC3960476.1 GMC family oxidoreductase [Polyangium jinanense]MDC3986751.1 GMC family oxidoreductase [Polyangium jinanense]
MGDQLTADVVIVGAGISGTILAHRLAKGGAKVLILESGPRVDRQKAIDTYRSALIKVPESPFPRSTAAPGPAVIDLEGYYVQEGPDLFKSSYLRLVGGTTWHWLGTTIRLVPDDFQMKTLFGVGVDWPITYDDLEPYYAEAEIELGVAGEGDLGSPRTTPYPMKPIPLTYSDKRIADAIGGLGYTVTTTAQARNTDTYDERPPCCGARTCIPVCPVVARYDASVHVKKAEDAGVQIVDEAIAHFIDIGADGRVSRIRFKRPDGSEHEASGKVYVLAAHAMETPKLLLMSKTGALPNGVSNLSDQVGRNLMDHPIQLSWALAEDSLAQSRGPLSTGGIDGTRGGAFRNATAAFRVEFGNDGWTWPTGGPMSTVGELVKLGLRGQALAKELSRQSARQLRLSSLMEQLPDPENRIVPAMDQLDALGIPRPRISYRVDTYTRDGMSKAIGVHDQIFDALGATVREHDPEPQGAGHVMGTYRMGADPATSVVDAQCRSHEHDNLFMLGSGTFPTAGTANPTLTIVALTLRAVAAIQAQL